jgi:hypothetical protein
LKKRETIFKTTEEVSSGTDVVETPAAAGSDAGLNNLFRQSGITS